MSNAEYTPRWSYTFLHPITKKPVTVDSGKKTKDAAHQDIREYLADHYGRGAAFFTKSQLHDRTAIAKAGGK